MNLYKNKIALLLVLGFSSLHQMQHCPSNISELVETSAPAVVNITSRKEVKMRELPQRVLMNSRDFLAFPEEEPFLKLRST